jgi:putative flippase GtrA
MLKQMIEFCTSDRTLFWIVLSSDVAIALAYFAIPITMAVVFRHRRDDIPYPWLWTLFVIFIVACGLTHVVHVASALTLSEHLGLLASVELITALASVGTAIAFTFVLPQIKNLPSPRQQRERLEQLVAERTLEKDQLIREINHRIGNQLQILSSLVSIESRKAAADESVDILARMRGQLDNMATQHIELSQRDYLGQVIAVDNGVITPLTSRAKVA